MVVLASSMDEKVAADIKKKTLLTVQDLKYARQLAENEYKVRKRALKYLKEYLRIRSEKSAWIEDNLKILWKGLFYSMWMADKPLVQEECAESIAQLIHSFNTFNESMKFFEVGLITLQNEWFGIDQHRLDKFLMLVRRLLRQALFVLEKVNFKKKSNLKFAEVLEATVLNVKEKPPMGLFMHFVEIYLEEVAKVSFNKLQKTRVIDLIKPFIAKLAFASDSRETKWISKFILAYLIKQHKLGIEYQEKYEVWRSLGFPGSIHQIQKVKVTESEMDESANSSENEEEILPNGSKPLDPRAGKVNVELPPINFDPKEISEVLLSFTGDQKTSSTSRNILKSFSENFKKLAQGEYPLGIKTLESKKKKGSEDYDIDVTKAAKKLMRFEKKLLARDNKDRKRKGGETEEEPVSKKKKMTEEDQNINKTIKKKNKKKRNGEKKVEMGSAKLAKQKVNIHDKKMERLHKIEQQIIQDIPFLKSLPDDADVEYIFKRNSGVWFVTNELEEKVKGQSPPVLKEESHAEDDQKSGNWQVSDNKTTNIVEALVGGQEIHIPSDETTKPPAQMSKTDQELRRIFGQFEGKSMSALNGVSSQPLLLTPKPKLASSPKKVRINTKMNMSQEIYEHILQVVSSPEIPYDSTKKPEKPVLKPSLRSTPINPFYKLKKSSMIYRKKSTKQPQ